MPRYERTQIAWPLVVIAGPPAILLFRSGALSENLPSTLLGVTLLLFGMLHVMVDDEAVRIQFGIGLVRKRIPLSRIRALHAVRNRWTWGWGIRMYPGGMLYNAAGLSAVELTLDNGKRVRIGTAEPARLLAALEEAMGPRAALSEGEYEAIHTHGRRWWRVRVAIVSATFAGLGVVFYVHLQPPALAVTADVFSARSGFYGVEIPLADVTRVTLEDQLPPIERRTNGFAAGDALRGYFRLAGLGRSQLFVNRSRPPFIVIVTGDGPVIVNYADPARTRQLYDQLTAARGRAGS
jgi:hypothetical protein